MAHFFTKHEMNKFDKKLSEENYLDASRYKTQLREEISKDNHRTNIDSAKKKAVLQGMNYDGFHQMVLGADLKGIKQGEIYSINSEKTTTIMNNITIQNKYKENIEILPNAFTVEQKENFIFEKIPGLINPEKEITFNQKHFLKEIKLINLNKNSFEIVGSNKEIDRNLRQKFDLIKSFEGENFRLMLEEGKLPSDIFLDLLNSFGEIIKFYLMISDIPNLFECFKYLKIFLNGKYYSSLKIFIGKKQKILYSEIIQLLEKHILEDDLNKNNFDDILGCLKNSFK
jgi:hypothetical protein